MYLQRVALRCLLILASASLVTPNIHIAAAQNNSTNPSPAPTGTQPPAAPGQNTDTIAPLCPAELGAALEAIATQFQLQQAHWGMLVQTQAQDGSETETLYDREAERYFVPASSAKLLTTAAVLQQLGPEFRIRTEVFQTAPQPGQTVLRVVGQGDPSLNDAMLRSLAQQLRRQDIRRIERLIGDDSYFQGPRIHPTWAWEDVQAGYGAPANSLIVNQNALDLTLWPQAAGEPLRVEWANPAEAQNWQVDNAAITVGATEPEFVSVGYDFREPVLRVKGQLRAGAAPEPVAISVRDPATHFLESFRRALEAEQIVVDTVEVVESSQGTNSPAIATVASPPLAQLLIETNQESDNLYAEALLRHLGASQNAGAGDVSSPSTNLALGLEALEATLSSLGVESKHYNLVDGSGLSRHNLASPLALVQALQATARSPYAPIYKNSLALAGMNGTLQERFRDTAAQGRLWGKTGTLAGIAALSGYLSPPDYLPLVFSVLINHSDQPAQNLHQAIAQMVLVLIRLQNC